MTIAKGAPCVLELLEYIEEVEGLNRKPAFSVPNEGFLGYQHELTGMPGVHFDLQADGAEVWMRIARLDEIPAPLADEVLTPWVTLPRSPDKSPELKARILVPSKDDAPVEARLEDHPEVQARFDFYVEFLWQPWAAAERPRRKTLAVYKNLFTLQQSIENDGADTPVELVWGTGFASWKKEGFATVVRHPLMLQVCEIHLNTDNFDLEVRPRDVDPRLETACYTAMDNGGVNKLLDFWAVTLAADADRPSPFEPSSYAPTLRNAVGALDGRGTYDERTEAFEPAEPSERLVITNTWVVFARKRASDIFLEDVRRLKAAVETAVELPEVVLGLVEKGSSTLQNPVLPNFRGLGGSDAGADLNELYFPMAYNDAQVSIIRRLHDSPGVVVQGPPGTGKTHTIANVICHYLAQGKRVLVTAKSDSALAVLRDKLPEQIRDLSVALLADEREGMKQFEHSIQRIANRVKSMDATSAQPEIEDLEGKLTRLHARIAVLDDKVARLAASHMQEYAYQGKKLTPEGIAKLILAEQDEHAWFDDELTAGATELPTGFDNADVSAVRAARKAVAQDLVYLNSALPDPAVFPNAAELVALHRELVRFKTIDSSLLHGDLLPLIDANPQTLTRAAELLTFLDERAALQAKLAASNLSWLPSLQLRLASSQPKAGEPEDVLVAALQALCKEAVDLERQRRAFLVSAVEVGAQAENNADFEQALRRLKDGRSPFALPFGKAEARKLVAGVSIRGSAPESVEDWSQVQDHLGWRRTVKQVTARWAPVAAEFGLDAAPAGADVAAPALDAWAKAITGCQRLVADYNAKLPRRLAEVLSAVHVDQYAAKGEAFLAELRTSIQAQLEKERLSAATNRRQALLQSLAGHDEVIAGSMAQFLSEKLGSLAADESVLQATWQALTAELVRLVGLKPHFDTIAAVSGKVSAAGAPKWAARMRTTAACADMDQVVPMKWAPAWGWQWAVMLLSGIDDHQVVRNLFKERLENTDALKVVYETVVAKKAWLGVRAKSPDSVMQALQKYLNAVQAMGAGTGKKAKRHRGVARQAMTEAYQAVPCWILPHWRVSETLPAQLKLFDLVIIDEASQSDIWALPALLRGEKALVVGDHKQVSPSAVGVAEESIKSLGRRFLDHQVFGSEMALDKSIYDLARVVFAGNAVMLQEHFRSVPAIIEYSNREFYENQIEPLRVPSGRERLDPPLVDVFVKGGIRLRDVNEPEAIAIVDEIESILADPQFNGRSIGVVTLMGHAQAARIHTLLNERISPVEILQRHIQVGPPPAFQGRERDIMMVSLVYGPGEQGAARAAGMEQRFNVALSRARDRMYLFRSVREGQVKPDSLTGRLLQHFRQPFHQDPVKVGDKRAKCESGFEKEMYDALIQRGYRVEPQVRCAGYHIDFVVEGAEGRRLAIECDGDKYHGLGQWGADMKRQRVLERAGWTFWRCFGSSFTRNREAVLLDLTRTLQALSIEPLGADSVDSTAWVYSKEVDPLNVGEAMEDDLLEDDEDELEESAPATALVVANIVVPIAEGGSVGLVSLEAASADAVSLHPATGAPSST